MFSDFLSLLFPRICELCNQGLAKREELICLKCLHELPRFKNDLPREEIYRHFVDSHLYHAFYAYLKFYKKGITQKLLHKIKYDRIPVLGERIGYLLGTEIRHNDKDFSVDLVVPIPLHPKKLKKRGYNQSDFFARGLARALNTQWSAKEIIRTTHNETQTNKTRQERINNVKGIFQVVAKNNIKNKHIMLVDDVVTTGATLESCAQEISEARARYITLAVLAIAK